MTRTHAVWVGAMMLDHLGGTATTTSFTEAVLERVVAGHERSDPTRTFAQHR